MELRVIEKTETELRIEIAGEDHTFMNVLKGQLLETEGVSAATYDVNPRTVGWTDRSRALDYDRGRTRPTGRACDRRWLRPRGDR